MKFGKSYHIQGTIDFWIGELTNQWIIVKPYVSIKNQAEAIEALKAMRIQGFRLMPCCGNCDKTGKCLGIN